MWQSKGASISSKYLIWAGDEVNRKWGSEHYLTIGASGSGKSTLINHVLHSVIPDPGVRALVYDPKQELVPFLYGLRGSDQNPGEMVSSVKILHPFDQRGLAWNMAADIDTPISARQLATILIPDAETSPGADGFYTGAVRDTLTGVLLAFIKCIPNQGQWTFRDVLLALLYEPYREFVLGLKEDHEGNPFPLLQRLQSSYFGPNADSRTKSNIQATLNNKLAIYEPVAAAWHRAELQGGTTRSFSLKAWMAESPKVGQPGSILVLGNDEAARAAIDPINQALFKRATELVLARQERTSHERESGENQIWFFLDEVREAGKLDGLGRLLTKGRSKNVCVVMGFQDIDGMREVYGKEAANEICAQFNNVATLRVNSPETAQWASNLFGSRLTTARGSSTGMSLSNDGGPTSDKSKSLEERPFLYTEAFLFGANAAAAGMVRGYRKGPDIVTEGASREEIIAKLSFVETMETSRIAPEKLEVWMEQATGSNDSAKCRNLVSTYLERPPSDQYLAPWDADDWKRLGWPGEPPPWASSVVPEPEHKTDKEKDQEKQWASAVEIYKTFNAMIEEATRRVANGEVGSESVGGLRNPRQDSDKFASARMRPIKGLSTQEERNE